MPQLNVLAQIYLSADPAILSDLRTFLYDGASTY
jgi:hypothetical protein